MRLFIAVPLATAVVDELSAISLRFRYIGDGLRWTAPASWHITLQFLGNTGREQYECTLAHLRQLRSTQVPVQLEGLGFFERAGVFFAGVKITPELLQLQKSVNAATQPCGFVPETRPYQPHITLARSRGVGQKQSLSKLKAKLTRQTHFTGFVAREFLLYESFLEPAGARYEIRDRFHLGDQ